MPPHGQIEKELALTEQLQVFAIGFSNIGLKTTSSLWSIFAQFRAIDMHTKSGGKAQRIERLHPTHERFGSDGLYPNNIPTGQTGRWLRNNRRRAATWWTSFP